MANYHLGALKTFDLQNNLKLSLGAKLDIWSNLRLNSSHSNNQLGFDIVGTGFFTGKLQHNWESKWKKISGRSAFLMLNIGVLNLNNRPGYNYNTNIPVISSVNSDDPSIKRKLRANGFRFQGEIGIKSLKIFGYATQYSYMYEGILTKGKNEPFGLVAHHFKYTIFLNRIKL